MTTFRHYEPEDFYDELVDAAGRPRPAARLLINKIESLPPGDLALRQQAAEALLLRMGITFNVYGRDEGTEIIFPAWGRDYGDVTPVKGVVMGGGVHALPVMVDVMEDPSGAG